MVKDFSKLLLMNAWCCYLFQDSCKTLGWHLEIFYQEPSYQEKKLK